MGDLTLSQVQQHLASLVSPPTTRGKSRTTTKPSPSTRQSRAQTHPAGPRGGADTLDTDTLEDLQQMFDEDQDSQSVVVQQTRKVTAGRSTKGGLAARWTGASDMVMGKVSVQCRPITPHVALAGWDAEEDPSVSGAGDATRALVNPSSSLWWNVEMCSQLEDFHITLSFPPHSLIGQLIPFTVQIVRVKHLRTVKAAHSEEEEEEDEEEDDEVEYDGDRFLYELKLEKDLWMMAGKPKVLFTLRPGETKSFSSHLLPIVCGYLPVPSLTLHEVLMIPEVAKAPSTDHDSSTVATDNESVDNSVNAASPGSDVSRKSRAEDKQTQKEFEWDVVLQPVPQTRLLQHFASHQVYVYPAGDFTTGVGPVDAQSS